MSKLPLLTADQLIKILQKSKLDEIIRIEN
jgi:predicted RNA binding protein YcfA (HicA-like mRNA interferase family)